MKTAANLWKWLLITAVVLLAGAAVYVSYELYRHQRILETSIRYNVAWSVSQSVTEFLRLQQVIYQAALEGEDSEASLRYDICVNRVSLMRAGEVARFVTSDPILIEVVDRFEQSLRQIEPLIETIADPKKARQALDILEPRTADLIRLSSASNVYSAARAAEGQADLIDMHWLFTAFVGVLITCGVILIFVLVRRMNELGSTKRRLEEGAQELRLALVQADAAGKAKARFLATMSHEVRTPMNAVLGLAGALLDEQLPPRQREVVETIRSSGDNLLRILNDILDFSKLDADAMTLEDAPFSPAALTREAVSLLAPRAAMKNLTVSADADTEVVPMLMGDAGRIRQILLNLISNAVKFTEIGHVSVQLRQIGRAGDDVTIEWIVRDTGIGIAQDRIGGLFGEFMQADATISHRYGGTGLGLAISKRLVLQMKGTIGVESAPGEGTVFRVRLTLPVTDPPPVVAPHGRDATRQFQEALSVMGRPLRILFAEDNPTNQFVIRQLLKGFTINLDMVADGTEAVESASSFLYDLICMDMRMPEMDGPGAARAIRAMGGRLAKIPIIAITANAFPEDIKTCLDAGMNHFVPKPVNRDTLLLAILDVLDMSRVNEQVPVYQPILSEPSHGDAGSASPMVDPDAFAELLDALGEEGIGEMLAVFVTEMDRRLALLAAGTDDRELLIREIHSTKGAAGTIGAARLCDLAAAIEIRLKAGEAWRADDRIALADAFHAYIGDPLVSPHLSAPVS
jgi:signal transduction histidine kinase/HPt (histidine-containing phosphotransfer) domain-containing protein/ActR/RegA family two-component response regulator